jgi:integrase
MEFRSMPHKPTVRWVERTGAWRSDVGPRSERNGRRRPVYFRHDADGHVLGPKDKAKAEGVLAAYVTTRMRQEEEARIDTANPTVDQLIEIFLQHCQTEVGRATMERRTYNDLSTALDRFAEFAFKGIAYKDRRARDLRGIDLARWMRSLETATHDLRGRPLEGGYGENYIIRHATAVKWCWSWAARSVPDRDPERILAEDPMREVRLPAPPESPERYVSPQQAYAFLAFVDKWAADAPGVTGHMERLTALCFRTIYESGCRPGEATELQWPDFNAELGFFDLGRDRTRRRRWRHKTGRKTKRSRRIPLTSELREAFLRERDRPGRHPVYVFTHRRGKGSGRRGAVSASAGEPWRERALGRKFRQLRELAAEAGLDVMVRDGAGQVPESGGKMTLYDFRRSFTTDAWEAEVHPATAAGAQGHSAQVAERIYLTRNARKAVEVAEKVARSRKTAG